MPQIGSEYSKNRVFRSLPFFVTFGLIVFLVHQIGLSRLAAIPREINLRLLLLAGTLTIPFVLLKSYKWKSIAQISVPHLTFSEACFSFLVGMGIGLLTPTIGELARAVYLINHRKEAFVCAVIDKLIDVTTFAILFLFSLLWFNRFGLILFLFCVFIGFASLYLTASWKRVFQLVFFQLQKLPLVPKRLLRALVCLKNAELGILIRNFILASVCLLILMLQFYMILLSFHRTSFRTVIMGLPTILIGSNLPISVAGLGLRETAAAMILPVFGVTQETAAVAAFLLFIVNSFIPGLVGLVLLGLRFITRPGKLHTKRVKVENL